MTRKDVINAIVSVMYTSKHVNTPNEHYLDEYPLAEEILNELEEQNLIKKELYNGTL